MKIAVTIAHVMNVIATSEQDRLAQVVRPEGASRGATCLRSTNRGCDRHPISEGRNRVRRAVTADERLDRYARLAVEVAVNLQPGQFLRISAEPEHLPLVRAIGRRRVRAGRAVRGDALPRRASSVRGSSTHPMTRLEWTPPWTLALLDHMIEMRGATIAITGEAEPSSSPISTSGAPSGHARVSAPRSCSTRRTGATSSGRSWATRTRAGRTAVFGEPDVERLWEP